MPIVKVEMWTGRTREQKAQLAKEITDSFERIGTPREATIVVFEDVAKDNWAQAGTLADES
jgi:4-oxalocrotonate tautomerase